MKITEFFQVLPTLLFAMVLVTLFGQKIAVTTSRSGSYPGRRPPGSPGPSSCACAGSTSSRPAAPRRRGGARTTSSAG